MCQSSSKRPAAEAVADRDTTSPKSPRCTVGIWTNSGSFAAKAEHVPPSDADLERFRRLTTGSNISGLFADSTIRMDLNGVAERIVEWCALIERRRERYTEDHFELRSMADWFIFESQKLEMIDRLKTSPPLSPSRTTTPVGKATSAPGLRSSESAALSIAPPCDDGRNRSPKARACIPALARLDICGAPKNEEVKSMDEFATLDGAAPNATVDLSALVKRTLQDFATDMPGSPMMGGMTSMVPCS